jgi:hypothetical protein
MINDSIATKILCESEFTKGLTMLDRRKLDSKQMRILLGLLLGFGAIANPQSILAQTADKCSDSKITQYIIDLPKGGSSDLAKCPTKAIPALITALQHPDGYVRSLAANALGYTLNAHNLSFFERLETQREKGI